MADIEQEKTSAEVIEIQDTEDKNGKDQDDTDSEEKTQFGLVWERYVVPPSGNKDSNKDKQSTDANENKLEDTTIKAKTTTTKFTNVFMPETEE